MLDYTTEISIKEILFKKLKKQPINLTEKKDKIKYLTPVFILPFRKNSFIKKINKLIYFNFIQIYLNFKHFKASKKLIWMFFPQLSFLLTVKNKNWQVVYDIVDSYSHINKKENEQITKQISYLLKKSDYIFSISNTLKEKFSTLTKKPIAVVPQGFDEEAFKQLASEKITLDRNKVNIGFVGQINERLDFNLINKLITDNQQWNFIFVGPKKKNDSMFSNKNTNQNKQLIKSKNCFWIEQQKRENIPQIIKQFDIAIIPYDMSLEFNRYCYPMKLFEYIYMSKPVVSTPIKELVSNKNLTNIVFTGNNSHDWQKIINKILKEKPFINKKLALDNSWHKKLEAISQKLDIK